MAVNYGKSSSLIGLRTDEFLWRKNNMEHWYMIYFYYAVIVILVITILSFIGGYRIRRMEDKIYRDEMKKKLTKKDVTIQILKNKIRESK